MRFLHGKKILRLSILIIIIVVLGVSGYFGYTQFKIYQEQQVKTKKLILSQQQALDEATNRISSLERKKSNDLTIQAVELEPYLSGIVEIQCDNSRGSGSLWSLSGRGYLVLTNEHVVKYPKIYGPYGQLNHCSVSMQDANGSGPGFYMLNFDTKYSWNNVTDIAAINIQIDSATEKAVQELGAQIVSMPVNKLNYKISTLPKCSPKMAVGSNVIIVGFPAFSGKTSYDRDWGAYVGTSFRAVTNGIISALDHAVTGSGQENLPFPNYFVSAKIDSGNSGGIAFSKNENGLCVLGVPTWLSLGQYETQGIIQNIYNVFYRQID